MTALVFLLVRTVVYVTLFVGFVLVYLPSRIVSGPRLSAATPALAFAGMIVAGVGAALVLWCVGSFVFVGRGTPFPLDPPRRLVVRGPYAYVRNPMYVGAFLVLTGAAIRFASIPLLVYAALFQLALHAMVVFYEERALAEQFGADYDSYRAQVRRWWPRARPASLSR